MLGVGDTLVLDVAEALLVPVPEREVLGVPDGVGVMLGVTLGEAPSESEAVGESETVLVEEGDSEREAVGELLGVPGLFVLDGVSDTVALGEAPSLPNAGSAPQTSAVLSPITKVQPPWPTSAQATAAEPGAIEALHTSIT